MLLLLIYDHLSLALIFQQLRHWLYIFTKCVYRLRLQTHFAIAKSRSAFAIANDQIMQPHFSRDFAKVFNLLEGMAKDCYNETCSVSVLSV